MKGIASQDDSRKDAAHQGTRRHRKAHKDTNILKLERRNNRRSFGIRSNSATAGLDHIISLTHKQWSRFLHGRAWHCSVCSDCVRHDYRQQVIGV